MRLLILILAVGIYAATPLDPVQAARAAQATTVCEVSINLRDSTGKSYCYLCKPDSGEVRVKLNRLMLSEKEVQEIAEWVAKLKRPLPLKE